MSLLSSSIKSNNHKLYFSKIELSKILRLYSNGVSKGKWKDYALDFNKNYAIFYIYKHTLSTPDFVLLKSFEKKQKKFIYNLILNNKKNIKFENLDLLILSLKDKNIKLIN